MVKLTEKKKKDYLFVLAIYILPAISFAVFWVGINFNSILLSFQKYDTNGVRYFVFLENFREVFSDFSSGGSLIANSLLRSFINYAVGLVVFFVNLFFSFYVFKRYFGHSFIRCIAMLPQVISNFIICLVMKKLFDEGFPQLMGFLGHEGFPKLLTSEIYAYPTLLLYSTWMSFSGYCIILPNSMNAIDGEIMESAELDGVNIFQEMWQITVPLIYPTIVTYIVTGLSGIFVNSGNLVEFYQTDAPEFTYNIGYYLFARTMNNQGEMQSRIMYPVLSAMGLVLTAVTAPIVFFVKRALDKYDYTEDKQ